MLTRGNVKNSDKNSVTKTDIVKKQTVYSGLSTDDKLELLLNKTSGIENSISNIQDSVSALEAKFASVSKSVDSEECRQNTSDLQKINWYIDSLE